jgi:hypothetical protein
MAPVGGCARSLGLTLKGLNLTTRARGPGLSVHSVPVPLAVPLEVPLAVPLEVPLAVPLAFAGYMFGVQTRLGTSQLSHTTRHAQRTTR